MPTEYVRKLAKKHGTSTKTAEQKWDKAKKAASTGDADNDWALTTHIFKNMMHEKSSIIPFALHDSLLRIRTSI